MKFGSSTVRPEGCRKLLSGGAGGWVRGLRGSGVVCSGLASEGAGL